MNKKQPKGNSGSSIKKQLDYGDGIVDDFAGMDDNTLTPLQSSIMEICKKSKSMNGSALADITQQLGDRYSVEEINNSVVALFDEGLIYSIKENHFKVTTDKQ